MIAIFTSPRPFTGEFDKIQRNAILSWKKLTNVKIFVFDDESKTSKKICDEYEVEYVPDVQKNKNGTPLMGDCLENIRYRSGASIVAHVSTDMILTENFIETIGKVHKIFNNSKYYMIGQRINIDDKLNLDEMQLDTIAIANLKKKGKLHPPTAMDYFVFPEQFKIKMPPFAIGRPGWDSWLIAHCKKNSIPIVDATNAISAFHQNHSYPSKKLSYFQEECDYNFHLAGGNSNLMNIREADFQYNPMTQKIERPTGLRLLLSIGSKFRLYGYALVIYRKIKKIFLT